MGASFCSPRCAAAYDEDIEAWLAAARLDPPVVATGYPITDFYRLELAKQQEEQAAQLAIDRRHDYIIGGPHDPENHRQREDYPGDNSSGSIFGKGGFGW